MTRLDRDKEEKIKNVDQHIEKLCTNIHKKVNTAYTNAKEILMETKLLNDKNSSDIQTQISLFVEMVEHNDLATLQAMESKLKGILDEVQERKPVESTVLTSPVTLQFREIDSDTLVEVLVAKRVIHSQQMTGSQIQAQDVFRRTYKRVRSVKTGVPVQRMRMINKQLFYSAGRAGIEVYSMDLKLIKKITNGKLGVVSSVMQFDLTGDLIVACVCGKGLHQLTIEGEHVSCITPGGRFSDVCCHRGKVYVLDYEECKIRVFQMNTENVWSETVDEQIELKYSNAKVWDKFFVKGDNVFVSSYSNHCINMYCISSKQHLLELGRPGQTGPGQLSGPVICNVDSQRQILVCDFSNKQVQVCEGGSYRGDAETGSYLALPGLDGYAADAVVGRHGHTLWVATHSPHEIVEYFRIINCI